MKKNLFIFTITLLGFVLAACGATQNPVETASQIAVAAVEACDDIGTAAGNGATCTNAGNQAEQTLTDANQNLQEAGEAVAQTGQDVVDGTGEMVSDAGENASGIGENVEIIAETVSEQVSNTYTYMGWNIVPGTDRYQNLFPSNGTSWTFLATEGMEILNWTDMVVTVDGAPYNSGKLVAGAVVVVTTFDKFGGNPRLVVTIAEETTLVPVVPWP